MYKEKKKEEMNIVSTPKRKVDDVVEVTTKIAKRTDNEVVPSEEPPKQS